jgi:SAM-dependent methyltransferase
MESKFDQNLASLLKTLLTNKLLIKGVLSDPIAMSPDSPRKIDIRPIQIGNQFVYQFTYQIRDQAKHQNLLPDMALEELKKAFASQFLRGSLFLKNAEYQILINRLGHPTILKRNTTPREPVSLEHNRKKDHLIPEGKVVPFLVGLDIMSPSGKIHDKKQDKFRQVNRFLEFIEDVMKQLKPRDVWSVVDFGCGSAYLTFALYYYLNDMKKLNVSMTGIDLKPEVIQQCQDLAKKLGYEKLHFEMGNIKNFQPKDKVDIMISLHACDTATDAALERAVKWEAETILSVPCCQHELNSQVTNDELKPLLKYGILKERFAALATDAARGQLLEIMGYRTQIIEFIDMEHTPKNIMIRAIRHGKLPNKATLIEEYLKFKNALKIFPTLEKDFQEEWQKHDSYGKL